MSDIIPHNITGSELATILKQEDYPVRYPKWAKCELSDSQTPGVRTQPLSLQTLAGINIVAHSYGPSLQRYVTYHCDLLWTVFLEDTFYKN